MGTTKPTAAELLTDLSAFAIKTASRRPTMREVETALAKIKQIEAALSGKE